MFLRVLTYNVHKGIGGVDRRYRPERVLEVVAHYEADFVFLQEVDEDVPRSARHRQAEFFAEALGYTHRVFQRNVRLRHGHYGNAILSRYPFKVLGDVDLTVRFKKRRQAIVIRAEIPVPGGVAPAPSRPPNEKKLVLRGFSPSNGEVHAGAANSRQVVLANIHLGLAGYERKVQLLRLLAHDYLISHQQDTPIIIGGDFNDVWGQLGRHSLEPAGFSLAGGLIRTFPAVMPLRPLDRLFHRGSLEVVDCYASRLEVARHASDHLPLIADYRLI